ncbi:hypothetical protein CPC08DRAFT_728930 [Agrocybe pediades]|nr:hypothetical protein CPC08DRAFT_728930 [Agrocybe pediades]
MSIPRRYVEEDIKPPNSKPLKKADLAALILREPLHVPRTFNPSKLKLDELRNMLLVHSSPFRTTAPFPSHRCASESPLTSSDSDESDAPVSRSDAPQRQEPSPPFSDSSPQEPRSVTPQRQEPSFDPSPQEPSRQPPQPQGLEIFGELGVSPLITTARSGTTLKIGDVVVVRLYVDDVREVQTPTQTATRTATCLRLPVSDIFDSPEDEEPYIRIKVRDVISALQESPSKITGNDRVKIGMVDDEVAEKEEHIRAPSLFQWSLERRTILRVGQLYSSF